MRPPCSNRMLSKTAASAEVLKSNNELAGKLLEWTRLTEAEADTGNSSV